MTVFAFSITAKFWKADSKRTIGMSCLNKPAKHSTQPCWPIRAALVGSQHCSALGIAAHSYAPVLNLCKLLVDTGINPATALHVYRGDMLCLIVRSIGTGARLEINAKGTGFIGRRAVRTAPPMPLNGSVPPATDKMERTRRGLPAALASS